MIVTAISWQTQWILMSILNMRILTVILVAFCSANQCHKRYKGDILMDMNRKLQTLDECIHTLDGDVEALDAVLGALMKATINPPVRLADITDVLFNMAMTRSRLYYLRESEGTPDNMPAAMTGAHQVLVNGTWKRVDELTNDDLAALAKPLNITE
jgi:hypothetical protein